MLPQCGWNSGGRRLGELLREISLQFLLATKSKSHPSVPKGHCPSHILACYSVKKPKKCNIPAPILVPFWALSQIHTIKLNPFHFSNSMAWMMRQVWPLPKLNAKLGTKNGIAKFRLRHGIWLKGGLLL